MIAPSEIEYWVAWWLVLVLYYLLLVAKASWEEGLAGVVGATLAGTAVLVTKQSGKLRFRVPLSWTAPLARLPWRVLAALWRRLVPRQPVRGVFRAIPFDPGAGTAG